MNQIINVLYIDDSTSTYVTEALNSIEIEIENIIYKVKCHDFDFDIENDIEDIFEAIKENNIEVVFVDSLLHSKSDVVRPHGMWIALILHRKFPNIRICTISSYKLQNENYNCYLIKYFDKIDRKGTENYNVLSNSYKDFIKEYIECQNIFKEVDKSFIDNYNKLDGKWYSVFEEMLVTVNKMKEGQNSLTNEEFEEIIRKLESFLDEKL